MSNLNVIMRHKSRDQSQFRVHFYLQHIYFEKDTRPELFLEAISQRISKLIPISHLQMTCSPKMYVDVSVGLQNDELACKFVQLGKRIILPGEREEAVEHKLILSEAFKCYYKAWCQQKLENSAQRQLGKQIKKLQFSPSVQKKISSKQDSDRKKYQQRRRQEDYIRVTTIWVFGIPLQCKQRQVVTALNERGVRTRGYEWRLKEDIEYLQVELYDYIIQKDIDCLDLKLDKYPLLILPKLQDTNNIYHHILKHQIEINLEKSNDQIDLIKLMAKVGGVLVMIKDQFYSPRKYVVAFNTFQKLQKAIEQLEMNFKNCYCGHPRHPVRLGRLQKKFSFWQIVQNLLLLQRG